MQEVHFFKGHLIEQYRAHIEVAERSNEKGNGCCRLVEVWVIQYAFRIHQNKQQDSPALGEDKCREEVIREGTKRIFLKQQQKDGQETTQDTCFEKKINPFEHGLKLGILTRKKIGVFAEFVSHYNRIVLLEKGKVIRDLREKGEMLKELEAYFVG